MYCTLLFNSETKAMSIEISDYIRASSNTLAAHPTLPVLDFLPYYLASLYASRRLIS